MRALLLAALALAAPTASGLDALTESARLGATEGAVVVRTPVAVRVAADGPLEAALADGPWATAPATLPVPPGSAWHGLPGAVEVRLRRPDAAREVRVELDDGQTGVVLTWPARQETPLGGAVLVLAAGLLAASHAGDRRRRAAST